MKPATQRRPIRRPLSPAQSEIADALAELLAAAVLRDQRAKKGGTPAMRWFSLNSVMVLVPLTQQELARYQRAGVVGQPTLTASGSFYREDEVAKLIQHRRQLGGMHGGA